MVMARHLEEHDPASDFQCGHVFGDRFRVERLIAAGGPRGRCEAADTRRRDVVGPQIGRATWRGGA